MLDRPDAPVGPARRRLQRSGTSQARQVRGSWTRQIWKAGRGLRVHAAKGDLPRASRTSGPEQSGEFTNGSSLSTATVHGTVPPPLARALSNHRAADRIQLVPVQRSIILNRSLNYTLDNLLAS